MLQGIKVVHLGVKYRAIAALEDITLNILPGRLTGIIGPNGAGKSTLLKAMLGLIPISQGMVYYQEKPLSQQLNKVAYVPQRSQIDWTYPATVWDVVMMGRVTPTGWFKGFSAYSRRQAMESLNLVQMQDFRNRPIGQLSGGQQQRVFLARSLAQGAEIFLFDEPFVGVDQKTENILFEIFHQLVAQGKIVLVVNHDLGDSITHFEDLILLNKSLVSVGERRLVLREENLFSAYGGRVTFFNSEAA